MSLRRAAKPVDQATLADGSRATLYEAGEFLGVKVTRVYDQITGKHRDLDPAAFRHDMTKYVMYCSSCLRTAYADGKGKKLITAHIKKQREDAIAHQHAEAIPVITPEGQGNRCTGCGAAFIARPHEVYEHISRAKAGGPKHRDAEVLVTKRFSLEPPVLEQPEATLVVTEEPTQVAPDDRRKSRRRRRHRGRRKGSAA